VAQYIPSTLSWQYGGVKVSIEQDFEGNLWTKNWDSNRFKMMMKLSCEKPTTFQLKLRLPWWLDQKAKVTIDGQAVSVGQLHGYLNIIREWKENEIVIEFADRLWTEPLPGSSDMYAFMEGPIVLAAADSEVQLKGDASRPSTFLQRELDQQYRTVRWTQSHYRTLGQQNMIRLKPLYEIADETYTIYFPISK